VQNLLAVANRQLAADAQNQLVAAKLQAAVTADPAAASARSAVVCSASCSVARRAVDAIRHQLVAAKPQLADVQNQLAVANQLAAVVQNQLVAVKLQAAVTAVADARKSVAVFSASYLLARRTVVATPAAIQAAADVTPDAAAVAAMDRLHRCQPLQRCKQHQWLRRQS